MNHPRYEKIHISCSCLQCTWRWHVRKNETLNQFKLRFKDSWWYHSHPEDLEKDYNLYKRKAENHIVYHRRKFERRYMSKVVRLAYKNNLKKGLDFWDQIVIIPMWYTD